MKITCIGTGTMISTTRGNQSVLIDNVLFDIGSGVVKKLESLKIYTKNIKYIVITHAHADHFVDLPNFLIGRSAREESTEVLNIICGKGIRKKVIELFELCFGEQLEGKYKNFEEKYNVEFHELENGQTFETEEMRLTGYELEHGNCKPILGYIFEKEGKVLGYATDTVLCENVKRICEKSEIAFLDANNVTPTKSHMSVAQVEELSNQYPNCRIVAIHRSDYNHENIKKVEFPEDGDIIEL